MPEVSAGIHNKTNNIQTIEAQFKEALIINKGDISLQFQINRQLINY